MKRHRHTPEQIVRKLRGGERLLNEGKDITEVVRHLEIAEITWNRWRSQYGGMKADEAKRLRRLETENARLKKLLAEVDLDKSMLKELAEGEMSDPGAQAAGGGRARRSLRGLRTPCLSGRRSAPVDPAPGLPSPARGGRRAAAPAAGDRPGSSPVGWKTAHSILRREGHSINKKRTRRLWRDEGLW